MADRWDAADGKPGYTPHRLSVGALRGVRAARLGEFDGINAVRTGGKDEHGLPIGQEDQRLHNLPNGGPHRGSSQLGRTRALRKLADVGGYAAGGQSRGDALD